MRPGSLLCSRNARPQKALVGRAQSDTTKPPSMKREAADSEIVGRAQLEATLTTLLGNKGSELEGAL